MDKEKVLVRRNPDGSFDEVGVVRKSAGKTLTISMHDGSDVVRERAKDELTPTRWSYIHRLRVYPDALARGLDEVPGVVFRQVLVETGKARCGACGDRNPVIEPVREIRNPEVVGAGWVERVFGRDALASPCWSRTMSGRFICGNCRDCPVASSSSGRDCLRCETPS